MLDGGADPLYLGRRLVRMAIEDIGLADPRALRIALDACETYERLGQPGRRTRAGGGGAVPRVARRKATPLTLPSTRRAHSVRDDTSRPVPERLRNAPTRLMKDLGYGRDYRYAHDEPDAYAAGENYFPEGMQKPAFYALPSAGWKRRSATSSRRCGPATRSPTPAS